MTRLKQKGDMFLESVGMSLSNITGNKMRTFLTTLGIIIGVAAIIALMTVVQGATDTMNAQFDAMGNVELPLIYAGVPPRERRRRAEEMLVRVGLKDRLHHHQNQLSGGQQQRVAIARALATNPTLLLADEPTGALDQTTGEQVMELFAELNAEGRTIIMITHDLKIARHASRIVHILDGELSEGVSAYD